MNNIVVFYNKGSDHQYQIEWEKERMVHRLRNIIYCVYVSSFYLMVCGKRFNDQD